MINSKVGDQAVLKTILDEVSTLNTHSMVSNGLSR
jgi:hypothetical protein